MSGAFNVMASNSSHLSKLPPISSPTNEKNRVDIHLKSGEAFDSSSRQPKGLHREQHGLVRLPPIVRLQSLSPVGNKKSATNETALKEHVNIEQDGMAFSVISLSGENVRNTRKNTINVPVHRRQADLNDGEKKKAYSTCSVDRYELKPNTRNTKSDWLSASYPPPISNSRSASPVENNRKNLSQSENSERADFHKRRLSTNKSHLGVSERSSNARSSIYNLSEFLSLPLENAANKEQAQLTVNKENSSLQVEQSGRQPRKPSVYDLREFLSLPEHQRSRSPSLNGQVPRHRTLSRAGVIKPRQGGSKPIPERKDNALRVDGKSMDNHTRLQPEKPKFARHSTGERGRLYRTEIPEIVTVPCHVEVKVTETDNTASNSDTVTSENTSTNPKPPARKLEARPAQVLDSKKLLEDLLEVLAVLNSSQAPHSTQNKPKAQGSNQNSQLAPSSTAPRRRLSDISVNWNNSLDSNAGDKTAYAEGLNRERVASVYNLVEFLAQTYHLQDSTKEVKAADATPSGESLNDFAEFLENVDFSPLREVSSAEERDANNNVEPQSSHLSASTESESRRSSTYDLAEFLQITSKDTDNATEKLAQPAVQTPARPTLQPRAAQINNEHTKNMTAFLSTLTEMKQPAAPSLQPRQATEVSGSLRDLDNFIRSLSKSLPHLQPRDARDRDNTSLRNLDQFLSSMNKKQPPSAASGPSKTTEKQESDAAAKKLRSDSSGGKTRLAPGGSDAAHRGSVYNLQEFLSMQPDTGEDKKISVGPAAASSVKTNSHEGSLSSDCQNSTQDAASRVREDTREPDSSGVSRNSHLSVDLAVNTQTFDSSRRKSSQSMYKLEEFLQVLNKMDSPFMMSINSSLSEQISSSTQAAETGPPRPGPSQEPSTSAGLSPMRQDRVSSGHIVHRNDSEKSLYGLKEILTVLNNASQAKQLADAQGEAMRGQGAPTLQIKVPEKDKM